MNLRCFGWICSAALGTILWAQDAEVEQIKKTVVDAYVNGTQTQWNTDAVAKGFHPDFMMFMPQKDFTLRRFTVQEWVASLHKRKRDNPEGPKFKTTHRFLRVEVAGNAAVAVLELYRDEVLTFTDFLSLYKLGGEWKIVSKIYHYHQP